MIIFDECAGRNEYFEAMICTWLNHLHCTYKTINTDAESFKHKMAERGIHRNAFVMKNMVHIAITTQKAGRPHVVYSRADNRSYANYIAGKIGFGCGVEYKMIPFDFELIIPNRLTHWHNAKNIANAIYVTLSGEAMISKEENEKYDNSYEEMLC